MKNIFNNWWKKYINWINTPSKYDQEIEKEWQQLYRKQIEKVNIRKIVGITSYNGKLLALSDDGYIFTHDDCNASWYADTYHNRGLPDKKQYPLS